MSGRNRYGGEVLLLPPELLIIDLLSVPLSYENLGYSRQDHLIQSPPLEHFFVPLMWSGNFPQSMPLPTLCGLLIHSMGTT